MKKYLMRGGISPLESMRISEIVVDNKIGDNSGNLVYLYSVMRSLMTEDTQIDMDQYDIEMGRYDSKKIDRINSEYAAYILPLADAFRGDYVNKLNNLTRFINGVKIPVYLIGVGLRASLDEDPANKHPYDDAVKAFLSAVLKKSAIAGLRGERTGAYLKGLGFVPEKDFTVIGCPSLYGFGRELGQRELHLSPESRISINYGYSFSPEIRKWLNEQIMNYEHSQFVGQQVKDLWLLYYGFPYHYRDRPQDYKIDWKAVEADTDSYPLGLKHPFMQTDRVRFFVDPRTWIRDMNTVDLSIGGRFHGSVAAILGGAPAYVICTDSRMKELAEYHGIPHTTVKEMKLTGSLEEYMEGIDPRIPQSRQDACFGHFLDFLRKNEIPSIYDEDPERKDAPLDQATDVSFEFEEVTNVLRCTPDEITNRVNEHNLLYVEWYRNLNERRMAKKDKELDELKKKLKAAESRYDRLAGGGEAARSEELEQKLKKLTEEYEATKQREEAAKKREEECREELKKAKLQLSRTTVKKAISAADLGRKVLGKKPIE